MVSIAIFEANFRHRLIDALVQPTTPAGGRFATRSRRGRPPRHNPHPNVGETFRHRRDALQWVHLQEHAQSIPKPPVEIGGRPILWHVMELYVTHQHGALATMTVVRPQLPLGATEIDASGRIRVFLKEPLSEQWINAEFLRFEPGAREYLDDDSVLELNDLWAEGTAPWKVSEPAIR